MAQVPHRTARIVGVYDAFAYEDLTVDSTSGGVAFTSTTYISGNRTAQVAVVTVETADARYTYDGTAPTTTKGHLVSDGDSFTIKGPNNIAAFRAIRTGGTSSVFRITYEG